MESVLPVARLILALPFAAAGIAALIRPLGIRRALLGWGVPTRAVDPVAAAVTLAEIAVAAGLLIGGSAWASAGVALCLLLLMCGVAVRTGLDSAAVSTVVRAAGLAIPAGIVLWEGRPYAGPSILPWLTTITPVQQIVVVAGVTAVVAGAWPRKDAQPEASLPEEADEGAQPERVGAPALMRTRPELTIGMATYDDFDGVYFTIQALRLYHDLDDTELLVVDNYGCASTREFVQDWVRGTYVLAEDAVGTAYAKDLVFAKASGAAVLCCDSHVLFEPGVIARLKRHHREYPDSVDLLQGPLVYDDGALVSTHFDPVWRDQMWGIWATDPRGRDRDGEPFEIPMQGLGVFSSMAAAWPGFHPGFRGFGGEEGYLHEKVRRAGGRCLCLPWLRWMHRFGRPRGVPYPLTVEDKLRNYLLGHAELGLDAGPVLGHFSQFLAPQRLERVVAEAAAWIKR